MDRMDMHDLPQARSQTPAHAHHANLPRIARGTINRAQADVLRSPRAAGLHHHLGHDRRHVGPHAVGPDDRGFLRLDAALQAALIVLNCALGADQMMPFMQALSNVAECFVPSYPTRAFPTPWTATTRRPSPSPSR